jgi:hypothetical protein
MANIVANLAVAAIVYLAGAALGIFPKIAGAMVSAAFILVMTAFFATAIVTGWRIRRGRGQLLVPVVVALFGIGFALTGVTQFNRAADPPAWVSIPFGIAFAALGGCWIWTDRRRTRANRQEKTRIKGLHWVELP